MYRANVYRIMIGCPSDITDEKDAAFRVLSNWNNLNSEKNRIVLLPIHWSISSYPAAGKHPQKLLNEQLVEKSDLMVCIFGTRLGSPTDTEISGTVEEIKEHRKSGKDVMVFFKMSVDDISAVNPQQLQKIKEFKESIKNNVLWQEFSDAKDFEKKFADALQLYINDHWNNDWRIESEHEVHENLEFSNEEKEIIMKWAKSRSANCHKISANGSVCYIIGGYQYYVKNGKEEADFDDYIERLMGVGFIELEKYNKVGKPIYKLKKAAYDYVDGLNNKEKRK